MGKYLRDPEPDRCPAEEMLVWASSIPARCFLQMLEQEVLRTTRALRCKDASQPWQTWLTQGRAEGLEMAIKLIEKYRMKERTDG